jgi:hypothetical protein
MQPATRQPLAKIDTEYRGKTDQAIDLVATLKLSRHDFAALAIACADQAGATVALQSRMAEVLGVSFADGEVQHCYCCGDVATVARSCGDATHSAYACEPCDESERNAAGRQLWMDEREAADERRGDEMRQEVSL